MRTLAGFIEALKILSEYLPKGLEENYFFEAEHDIIYSHVSTEECTAESEDGMILITLGWHVNSEIDVWAYFT